MARTVSQKFTRKPPSEKEQARRKEWAAKWSQVGKQWKQTNNPKG